MKTKLGIVIFVTFVALVGLLSWQFMAGGVDVTLTNVTGGEISGLRITFTGGTTSAATVEAAGVFTTRVNPSGESHLIIEHVDSSGKQHTNVVDVYLEHNYRGKVHISIHTNGSLTWKDETKSWANW